MSKDFPKPKCFNVLNVHVFVFSHIFPCDAAMPRFLLKTLSPLGPEVSRAKAASFMKMVSMASFDVRMTKGNGSLKTNSNVFAKFYR